MNWLRPSIRVLAPRPTVSVGAAGDGVSAYLALGIGAVAVGAAVWMWNADRKPQKAETPADYGDTSFG